MCLGGVAAKAPLMESLAAIAIFAGTMLPLAIIAIRESTGRREEVVGRARAEAQCTSLATQLADMTNRHNEEKERADRADETIAQLLAEMAAGPAAAGSYSKLLTIIAAAKGTTDRDGARGLHQPASPDTPASRDLLIPGRDW